MTPEQSTRLIEAAGGNQQFARLLGIDKSPRHKQRVSNWRRRGIPPAVVLEHRVVFDSLEHALGDADRRRA